MEAYAKTSIKGNKISRKMQKQLFEGPLKKTSSQWLPLKYFEIFRTAANICLWKYWAKNRRSKCESLMATPKKGHSYLNKLAGFNYRFL